MEEIHLTVKETNNPAILKFEASKSLVKLGSYEYQNIDQAKDSPLAQQLFYLPFIKTVYISGNFIALERYDIVSWEDVKDEVAQQLVEALNSGMQVVQEAEEPVQRAVTVYAEVTPNPGVMKYVANIKLVSDIFEFKNIEEAKDAPLATALFQFPFVKEVFMDLNYISVTKYDVVEWEEVSMELREMIRNYLMEGKEVVSEAAVKMAATPETGSSSTDYPDDISREIAGILDEYVKPAVASDGGNIVFQSYDQDSKTVNVILQGACSGCPSSTFTLKNGIETMLKNMLGDKINEVVALNG